MSARRDAPYHTEVCSPSVTDPVTALPGARNAVMAMTGMSSPKLDTYAWKRSGVCTMTLLHGCRFPVRAVRTRPQGHLGWARPELLRATIPACRVGERNTMSLFDKIKDALTNDDEKK